MEFTKEQKEWFRLQGAVGGSTAAAQMTPEARKQRAEKAARKRWKKNQKEKGEA